LFDLAGTLTDRDRQLCRILQSHRVLTTAQVADIAFGSLRRAEQRLAALHARHVVDRFRPRVEQGSAPYHWVLGSAGAAALAAEAGTDPASSRWRRDTAIALAGSSRLAHLVGVNGSFTALIRTARTSPPTSGCELVEWWSEARCAAEWGEVVRPDGYGVWAEGGRRLPFLLEYDRATERLRRLGDKLSGYADLAAEVGHPTWVCFVFPTPGREAAASPVLGHPAVPVATAVLTARDDPAGPVWLPTSARQGPRLRLIDLASQPTRGHLPRDGAPGPAA
jgi:hypothetical protein